MTRVRRVPQGGHRHRAGRSRSFRFRDCTRGSSSRFKR
jgi:hypothetical protein